MQRLKQTLVVTTGENYVGAAEPQLREKLSELYAKVANSFERPSKAEMLNWESLELRFSNAVQTYKNLQEKYIQKQLSKLKQQYPNGIDYKSKEEYLKK